MLVSQPSVSTVSEVVASNELGVDVPKTLTVFTKTGSLTVSTPIAEYRVTSRVATTRVMSEAP